MTDSLKTWQKEKQVGVSHSNNSYTASVLVFFLAMKTCASAFFPSQCERFCTDFPAIITPTSDEKGFVWRRRTVSRVYEQGSASSFYTDRQCQNLEVFVADKVSPIEHDCPVNKVTDELIEPSTDIVVAVPRNRRGSTASKDNNSSSGYCSSCNSTSEADADDEIQGLNGAGINEQPSEQEIVEKDDSVKEFLKTDCLNQNESEPPPIRRLDVAQLVRRFSTLATNDNNHSGQTVRRMKNKNNNRYQKRSATLTAGVNLEAVQLLMEDNQSTATDCELQGILAQKPMTETQKECNDSRKPLTISKSLPQKESDGDAQSKTPLLASVKVFPEKVLPAPLLAQSTGINRSPSSIKEALLRWCQAKTRSYPNVNITNFSSSWADGLAFCALIHHFCTDAFDYAQLLPENRKENFDLAFKTADSTPFHFTPRRFSVHNGAERFRTIRQWSALAHRAKVEQSGVMELYFGQTLREKADIYPLLETADMLVMGDKPDWKCVFTYVQSIYRHFRDQD